jgi:aldehyde dehydrogenase family 7 protein A1
MSQDTKFLKSLNISSSEKGGYDGSKWFASGETFPCVSPHDNKEFTKVQHCTLEDYEHCVKNMQGAWRTWASLPAPKRGDIVRQLGEALRANLKDLGAVISLEMGKIAGEGIGEVQETIDICDFACGLSRAING